METSVNTPVQNMTIMQRLEALEQEKLDPKLKKKEFKMGFFAKILAKRSMSKKSKRILAFVVRRNMTVYPTYLNTSEGMIELGDARYNYDPALIMLFKGRVPCVIIFEWHLNPVGMKSDPSIQLVDPTKYKDNVSDEIVMLRAVQQKMNETKKKAGGFMWIFIIAGILILAYVIFGKKLNLGGG
jgi:hypothetical protein